MKSTHRWPDDDPIVGSKLVALCNNKSPFVTLDGFFSIYSTTECYGTPTDSVAGNTWINTAL
jgi:hypothetical protein